ncbi:MAG: hypothetical protein ACT4NU_03605, partial [Chromatiales bacterium]
MKRRTSVHHRSRAPVAANVMCHSPTTSGCGKIKRDTEAFPMSTVKEELTRLIQGQPDDSS